MPSVMLALKSAVRMLLACPLSVIPALTGCDVVSSFCGKGNKYVWESWKVYPEVTNTFNALANKLYCGHIQ